MRQPQRRRRGLRQDERQARKRRRARAGARIDGTPLEGTARLTPRDCLRGLAMMRLVNPSAEIRIAGGREIHLGSLQPLGLYAANSMFVGDYLTTKGQLPESDYRMIEEMGFVITRGAEAAEPPCETVAG